MTRAGADESYRRIKGRTGVGSRLAPHRTLRHLILVILLEAGLLAPVVTFRRLDDAISESSWGEDALLEETDWQIVWNESTRAGLPHHLESFLDLFESTPRTREVLLQTWQSLAIGECLAFSEYALRAYNLNPALARSLAPTLATVLGQMSIGQCCSLMWLSARHLASWFMRTGVRSIDHAERELLDSVCSNANRAYFEGWKPMQFTRHGSIPLSTFADAFIWASKLGQNYWSVPVSESALDEARPQNSDSAYAE